MDGCSQRWVLTTLKGVSPVSGDTPLFVVRLRRSHPLRLSLGGSRPRVARLCFAGKSFFCVCPAASVLGFLIGENDGLLGFVTGVVTPVRLHEHGVDLFEVNGFGVVAHGFDEGADTEVSNGPQDALGDAQDEVEGVIGEGVVR